MQTSWCDSGRTNMQLHAADSGQLLREGPVPRPEVLGLRMPMPHPHVDPRATACSSLPV